ncbi:MAG: UDPGP type 1 family protein [Clostridia bacterium]|nr:UDPGP type 1 family protein [Clostridia bacterium]MBR3199458.1 UDPGP type 1 family protein [Bacilli bacterium]
MDYNEMKSKLEEYNQMQILKAYDRADEKTKKELECQIERIDFKQVADLFETTKNEINFNNDVIESIAYVDKEKLNEEDYKKYLEIGEKAIKDGKYSVVTMAGGQGTRLGHSGPKGTFDIGLDSHKSIFEILIDTLKENNEKYGVIIPWYVMTGKENHEDTVKFFEDNNYFGYDKNSIKFFQQGKLPMCDESGKILINEQGVIKEAADGHGGIFQSMKKNGITEDMEKRGVEWAFVGPVDNVLVKMVDPILLGIMIDKKVLAGGKSTVKANPSEKVGVFCRRNGKPGVVEYTEITQEMAERVDENGELVFGESHINCNMFNVKVIEEVANKNLPYHIAHKKASFIDENGNLVVPEKPNAYKFESFIFDAFDMLDDMAILRVKREEEFAPVKNAAGTDSPETAKKLYLDYYNNLKK